MEAPAPINSASLHPEKDFFVAGGDDFKLYKFDYSNKEELGEEQSALTLVRVSYGSEDELLSVCVLRKSVSCHSNCVKKKCCCCPSCLQSPIRVTLVQCTVFASVRMVSCTPAAPRTARSDCGRPLWGKHTACGSVSFLVNSLDTHLCSHCWCCVIWPSSHMLV